MLEVGGFVKLSGLIGREGCFASVTEEKVKRLRKTIEDFMVFGVMSVGKEETGKVIGGRLIKVASIAVFKCFCSKVLEWSPSKSYLQPGNLSIYSAPVRAVH
jgi:hypothetical protein